MIPTQPPLEISRRAGPDIEPRAEEISLFTIMARTHVSNLLGKLKLGSPHPGRIARP
jgi:hypothetical protein